MPGGRTGPHAAAMSTPTSPTRTTPPLLRRPDDRVVGGVCASVARTTGTDPVLWRVVLAVLSLFGGTGVLLYVAGWLLIPAEGEDASPAERLLRGRVLSRSAVVVLVLAVAVVAGSFVDDGAAVPVLAAAVLGYVVVRGASDRTAAPPAAVPPPPSGAAWLAPPPADPWSTPSTDPFGSPTWTPEAPYAPPGMAATSVLLPDLSRPVPPRPVRSALGPLTLGAALLLVAGLLVLKAAGVDGITVGRLVAGVLLVVGGGLLVGARWGRSRGLIVLATALCAVLAVTTSARVPVDLSVGERTWVVLGSEELRLGVGEAVVDLQALPTAPSSRPVEVSVRMGAGHLVVLLPDGLQVQLDAHLTAGEVVLPGEDSAAEGTDLRVLRTYGPAGAAPVLLDVEIGAGQLEVRGDAPAAAVPPPAPEAPAAPEVPAAPGAPAAPDVPPAPVVPLQPTAPAPVPAPAGGAR